MSAISAFDNTLRARKRYYCTRMITGSKPAKLCKDRVYACYWCGKRKGLR